MNKKEVLELKRRLKKDQATFTRLVGCYVTVTTKKYANSAVNSSLLRKKSIINILKLQTKFCPAQ